MLRKILLPFVAAIVLLSYAAEPAGFRFVILGDRTGEAVQGVYREIWREVDRDRPDFVVTVGDTIQGGDDRTVDAEWRKILQMLAPYRRYRIFFTPGNHDVWSEASARAYEKYTRHPLHYSFDYRQAHFTILDNSRSDRLPDSEFAYLQKDLEQHKSQPVKFIVSHRPSWILNAALGNPNFPLHQLAKRYGVKYVIAGHIHQMLHFEVDGVTYLSMPSAGGHLRLEKQYDKGWFFAHTLVSVSGDSVSFEIKEAAPPYGQSRVTQLADWGVAGRNVYSRIQ
ncbi:MAG TPA: metallophosphoesterase [Bryobacteraceae bacterium]